MSGDGLSELGARELMQAFAKAAEPRWFGAHCFRRLISGEDSGGRVALFDFLFAKGFDLPAHTHAHEDEAFFVLEGKIRFQVRDEHFDAGAGEFVKLPRHMSHSVEILTPSARALLLLTPPQLEGYLMGSSTPATEMAIRNPGTSDIESLIQASAEYELEWH